MRAVLPFLAVALAATSFAGCLDTGEVLSAERPAWKSGYSFAYEITGFGKYEERHEGGQASGNQHQEGATDPKVFRAEVVNTQYKNGDVPVYVSATLKTSKKDGAEERAISVPGSSDSPRLQLVAHRQSDLAGVSMGFSFDRSCEEDTCTGGVGKFAFGPDPPFTYLDFPLTKGKSWSGSTAQAQDGDELVWSVKAKAGGAAWVDLPPGRVRAIPVDFTFTPENVDALIQRAKAQGEVDEAQVHPAMHLKVFYAPDYETVVRSEYLEKMDYIAVGKDEGEPVRTEVHSETTRVTLLTGAKLIARPERDLAYITRLVTGEIPLGDATGQAQRPVGYGLELTPSAVVVNAFEKPTVTFDGRILGDPTAFAGHTATWRILDFAGGEVDHGDGLTFSHAFEQPGYYTAELETQDRDHRTAASTSTFVAANYEGKAAVGCTVVALEPLVPGCPSVPVPVFPGVRRIVVGATGDGPVKPLVSAHLDLTDPSGHVFSDESATNGAYELVVEDLGDAAVTGAPWDLQLVENRALLQQAVEYSIQLDYAQPAAKETGPGETDRSIGIGVPTTGLRFPGISP